FLEVRASNQIAIGLYEHCGFAEYCRRADYYGTGQDREDAVLMSRLFDFG
ncbi:MAG: ribosomal protein S18-alanine N-acetyltransferase, partial [Aeromonas sp.]